MTPTSELHCPLCGEANACAPAASGHFERHCWCQDVVADPIALERLPAAERGRACLCRRCVTGATIEHAAGTAND